MTPGRATASATAIAEAITPPAQPASKELEIAEGTERTRQLDQPGQSTSNRHSHQPRKNAATAGGVVFIHRNVVCHQP